MPVNLDSLNKILVVGGGVMGNGIAQVFARNGYAVSIVDVSDEILTNCLMSIRDGPYGLMRLVERGRMTLEDVEQIMRRIRVTTDYSEGCKDAQLAVEAVPEVVEQKQQVFRKIEQISSGDVVLASNTSSIMISEIARAVQRPEMVIGMHFFNPAPVMKLVEVVRGALTRDDVFYFAVQLSKRLGKVPIEAKDGPGFFTTRFVSLMMLEAVRLFEQGVAGIKEMDEMCKLGFGWPMGPFELMDLTGIDVNFHVASYFSATTGHPGYSIPISMRRLYMAGFHGKKAGSKGGWYDYYKLEK